MKYSIKFMMTFLIITSCSLLDSSDGSSPDIPGKLVFAAQDSAGTSQIFTMKADGSELQQLTHFAKDGDSVNPAWSPDGQQIVFSSFKFGTSNGPALWVMDADGGNRQVLYDAEPGNPRVSPLLGNHARWSPDGTKVAFDLCLNCQLSTNLVIYVFDLATKQRTRITEEPAGYKSSFPAWSPDGAQIAFTANRDYVNAETMRYRTDLYVMDADGSNQQRLTETGNATRPVWNPDGNKIAYEWNIQGNEVFLDVLSSGQIHNVETGFKFAGNPQWNNQGTQLMVFGRETEQTQTELRLLSIEEESIEIMLTIPLDESAIGRNNDWFIPTEN